MVVRLIPLIAGLVLISAAAANAQRSVGSIDELRRELAAGDFVTLVPAGGPPLTGRLTRLGFVDLDIRPERRDDRGEPDITITLAGLVSLERRPDPAKNGAVLGAAIGAGAGGAMFVYALAVDRNEIDEWAGQYAAVAAAATGIGGLTGWLLDKAISRPHIRFDVQPIHSRGRGIALRVSIPR